MIVSETTHRSRSRWLQACVLLVAMFVLPLGVAIAQDYDAVEKRLGAAVAEGEITLEQAEAMMGALRMTVAREGMIHRIREIEAAVKAGRMSREEGERLIAETRRGMEKAARGGEERPDPRAPYLHRIREIEAAVEAGRMSREEGERAMVETRRAMEESARKGDATERNHDEGLVGHYRRMGVSTENLGAFKKALADAGVKDKQMEGTLGGMLRVVHKMKSEGDGYEMDPRMAKYLKDDLGLTNKQIELVEGIARRVLYGMKDSDGER